MDSKPLRHPFFQEGMQAYMQRDYHTGVRKFSEYLEQEPHDPVALTNRGAAWLLGGEPEKALVDFNASIAKTYHLRGLVRLGLFLG